FALLVANWLAVDDKGALRVVSQGMEQTVAIGRNATRAVRDRLAQAAGGIDLDEVPGALHRDTGLGSGQGQCSLDLDGDGAADAHILSEDLKARCRYCQVIRIRGYITESERAVGTRDRGLFVAADCIVDGHRSLGNDGAGGIDDTSFNGTRVSQRLAERRMESDCKEEERTQSENLHIYCLVLAVGERQS